MDCDECGVRFSKHFWGVIALSGHECPYEENLSARDEEYLVEFFTQLKASVRGREMPSSPRHAHILFCQDIHCVTSHGENPPAWRDVKCLSAKDKNKPKDSKRPTKNTRKNTLNEQKNNSFKNSRNAVVQKQTEINVF